MDNYEKLLERISRSSGLEKKEIERKIEAKKAKLSGLISKEGAAQIVAAELGINFSQERLKISELVEGMKRANVLGKIIKINPIKEFNKNNRQGKVASFLLGDDSSNVRVVLWDTNQISLIEKGSICEGGVIEVSNANMRNGELHLNSFSDIKISSEKIDSVIYHKIYAERKLSESKPGDYLKTRASIVKSFDPRYFEVCPECGKKVVDNECKTHGKISPQRRALLSLIIDDGSDSMRTTLFGEQITHLNLEENEIFSLEEFAKVKEKILGEEKIFAGLIKNNALYNTIEFNIEKIENLDLDSIIKDLEARSA